MRVPNLWRPLAAASGLAMLTVSLVASPSNPASAAGPVTLYASPNGTSTTCQQSDTCSLTEAQKQVRAQSAADGGADVTVKLLNGTYRLSSTWKFGEADSGSPGHPVVWEAADGAHPVISGGLQVSGWSQTSTPGVWSASVPEGSASRQLYVNGRGAPIARAHSIAELGFKNSWKKSDTGDGYNIKADDKAMEWFKGLSAAEVAQVEFHYPGAANGRWTDSRCRVDTFDAGTGALRMAEPCWTNITNRADFRDASGGLPSMTDGDVPRLVENAKKLLRPGQWYLDAAANTLYYQPMPGQSPAALDVELPRLESLVQVAGTLAAPVHDLTFRGLQFSHATWNAPSGREGFADVQSNLRMTETPAGGSTKGNQGMCRFSDPAGTCPWGALTQPVGNVAVSAAKNVTFSGNRFAGLGGAGLSVMYGSANTLIRGNEFTDIASTALLLGCTYDPTPVVPVDADRSQLSPPDGIKKNCTPNPSEVSGDTIGENEILTGTTVSDNIVHRIGTDYSSASGITLLFSRGTKITHNNVYDVPYTAVTAGVIQGHVDNANHPQNSVNINNDNSITNNVFHHYLAERRDGGAVYVEGHQAQYYDIKGNRVGANGPIDKDQTLNHGLQVTQNVAYDASYANFTYYDDAGAEWIKWQENVAFNAGGASQGGSSPTGHIRINNNYFSAPTQSFYDVKPVDVYETGTKPIPAAPGPKDIPKTILAGAGVTAPHSGLAIAAGPSIAYVSPTTESTVLIAGEGFTSGTPVYVGTERVSGVEYLSGSFLIAPVPAGTPVHTISVGAPNAVTRVNDTDAAITYSSGYNYDAKRGFGDYKDDVHFATADGSTTTYTFSATGIQVYGEQFTDQGGIGVSIDGGTMQIVNTKSEGKDRHANAVLYTATGLTLGNHTIVITKLSGNYSTLDGFAMGNVGAA
ncbi:hypothetical protein ACFWJ4_37625 [Kitasatospora sp. NPDC127067]|uniref:hypothetical protein n=1 Tax=Kitasatospora sp. NPDC127067 TaxID=3347126 RepID=UPI0036588570